MEKIYTELLAYRNLHKACPETVRFLLDYSKALHVFEYGEMDFESILN